MSDPETESGESPEKGYGHRKRTGKIGKERKDCPDDPEVKNIKRRLRHSKKGKKRAESSGEDSAGEIPESDQIPSTSICDPKPSKSKRDPKPSKSKDDPKPSMSKRDPKPSTSKCDPKPSTSKCDPKPSTSKRDPKPSKSKRDPKPSMSKRDPKSSKSKRDPKPSMSKRDPKPSTSRYDPEPSTSRYDPEPSTSRYDPEPSTSRLPEGNVESNAKKNIEKIIEEKLFKRCALNYKIAEFLHDQVFYPVSDDSDVSDDDEEEEEEKTISPEERLYIKQLLEKMEEMNKKVMKISNENKDLEKEVLQRKMDLKKLVNKRKKLWNEAAKKYEESRKDQDLENSENSDSSLYRFSRYNSIDNPEYKKLMEEVTGKMKRVHQLARVLHRLICFSGARWAYDKNLLEIVLCTGKLLNFDVNVHGLTKYEKVLDEVIYRFNFVKM